jgi:hypothetical protein
LDTTLRHSPNCQTDAGIPGIPELIQHLSRLTRGGTVDRETIAIDHAGVLNAESLDKYRQMRQRRA